MLQVLWRRRWKKTIPPSPSLFQKNLLSGAAMQTLQNNRRQQPSTIQTTSNNYKLPQPPPNIQNMRRTSTMNAAAADSPPTRVTNNFFGTLATAPQVWLSTLAPILCWELLLQQKQIVEAKSLFARGEKLKWKGCSDRKEAKEFWWGNPSTGPHGFVGCSVC